MDKEIVEKSNLLKYNILQSDDSVKSLHHVIHGRMMGVKCCSKKISNVSFLFVCGDYDSLIGGHVSKSNQ